MCCRGEAEDDDEDTGSSRPQRNVPGPNSGPNPGPGGSQPQPGPSVAGGIPGSPVPLPFYPGNPFGGIDRGITSSDGWKKRVRRLYCETGYDLAVFSDGKVGGVKNPRNRFGNLIVEAVGLDGEVKIRGVTTGFYITMTTKGRVKGQPNGSAPGTVWVETRIGEKIGYMSLLSLDFAHKGWYLAIKKSGKMKAGPKTNHPYPQKAITFLPRIVGEVSAD